MVAPGVTGPCPQCGGVPRGEGDSCEARFERLLALDHSRIEPWGSRHGLAFAAYVLQHPDGYHGHVVARSWQLLHAVFHEGHDPAKVTAALRRSEGTAPPWLDAPPPSRPAPPFAVTIQDLGDFDAEHYAIGLERWCRATLSRWGGP